MKWKIKLEWKPQYCWVGFYWQKDFNFDRKDIWICLLPMVPIHIWSECPVQPSKELPLKAQFHKAVKDWIDTRPQEGKSRFF